MWALCSVRSPRYSFVSWLFAIGLVTGCGYLGQLALVRLQNWTVSFTGDLISGSSTDPYQSVTDIGHIGELKLSDRILVRLTADQPIPVSFLLHRATYDSYAGGKWLARSAPLTHRQPDGPSTTWRFDETESSSRVAIHARLNDGKGVLPLPSTTVMVEGLEVDELESNLLGTVRVEKGANFVSFIAHFAAALTPTSPPREHDLKIPINESAAIAATLAEWGLDGRPQGEVVIGVSDRFARHFGYSIYQSARLSGNTPIADFLGRTRSGHCEYFATATVLLLRAAGIPARYATGYSVQEYSELEHAYVVRQRHAHSWARYYLNARWHDLDTTPGVWAEVEQEGASILEPLTDLYSWIRFGIFRARADGSDSPLSVLWGVALVPFVGFVVWRLRLGKRRQVANTDRSTSAADGGVSRAQTDFYLIEEHFKTAGFGRLPAEPVTTWVKRLESAGVERAAVTALPPIVSLHYEFRFDPAAGADENLVDISRAVSTWFRHHVDVR